MSIGSKKKEHNKPGLVPTTAIYCVIALALFLAPGLVLTDSLIKISELATDTRDRVLPTIMDRQRTAENLERLGRYAEIIHRSDDAAIRQEYKLAARILAHDDAFAGEGALETTVNQAYRDIESIALLRDRQDELDQRYQKMFIGLLTGTARVRALDSIPQGAVLTELLTEVSDATDKVELTRLVERYSQATQAITSPSAEVKQALEDGHELLAIRHEMIGIDGNAQARWEQVDESLKKVTANLSTRAAVKTDEGFTIIAAEADQAIMTNLLAGVILLGSLLVLLFFAQRNIVAPILRSIAGLNRISRGHRVVTLREEKLKELDDIRQAIERSALLVTELAETNKKTERTNRALETEITQRQKTQELLGRAKERAEAADRAKSDFLAGMSHEIRTPMNSMIGMIDLLKEEDPTPKQLEYIETLKASGNMLLRVINDVLDLSKIEAGEVELEVVDIDRDQFLESTRQIVAGGAEVKGLDFVIDVDDGVPSIFRSDPTRLRQVLVNLIDNGIKFTREGEVRLTIQRSFLDGNDALTFAVIDTGIGIPEEAQREIFNRFAQADSSTTRRFGGTGLGLSICQCLVELMGGSLKLESTPGQGAAFYFTLCMECLEKSMPENILSAPVEQSSLDALQYEPLSILVAEDSESNRALVDLYFKKTACTLDFAENGSEAIDKYSKYDYSLILMDIQMPGMDGYEATRRIRALEKENGTPPVPILAVTANAFKEDREQSRNAGCTDYLAKPVSKTVLLERVAFHAIQNKGKDV